jgi:H+/Cl- antiporter ClcA
MSKQNQTSSALQRLHSFLNTYPTLPFVFKWLAISLILGLFIGTASAGFLYSLDWVTAYRESHLWIIALLPIGGLGIGLLYHYYGKDIQGGNNVLIESIQTPTKTIPFKMVPFIYIGTIVTHLLGGSAGREGTALQIAGAIADQWSKPLRLTTDDRKILLIASIAAGFGAVFGTPLAGAIFALELAFIGRVKYNALWPSFAVAIIADRVTLLWNISHNHYPIQGIPTISYTNILYVILAGLVFGFGAKAFIYGMHWTSKLFKSFIKYPPLRPFVGGVLLVIIIWLWGTTKYIGLGIPTITLSFHQQLEWYDFAIKMGLTILTLAAGFKGGEVTPLFFIGAALGNALSLFIPLPMSLLAGMGFVAVFAGATNTPLACCMMAIELFGIECGLYTSIACVLAYIASGHRSIYKLQTLAESKLTNHQHQEGQRIQDL